MKKNKLQTSLFSEPEKLKAQFNHKLERSFYQLANLYGLNTKHPVSKSELLAEEAIIVQLVADFLAWRKSVVARHIKENEKNKDPEYCGCDICKAYRDFYN